MHAVAIVAGLACGALLAAVGLLLWAGAGPPTGIARSVAASARLAGLCLLVGVLLSWNTRGPGISTGLSLLAMAIAATPFKVRRLGPRAALPFAPALLLAAGGLAWAIQTPIPVRHPPVTVVALVRLGCGAVGARAIQDVLGRFVAPRTSSTLPYTYAALTLLLGGLALFNLGRLGTMWAGAGGERGLAGAWLAWSASRLPALGRRWRLGLIAAASALLIGIALA